MGGQLPDLTKQEDNVARLPVPTRDDIPEGQRETFDQIVERMGRVPQVGPEAAMIYVPEAHKWIAGLSNYLRFESALSMRTRELAILVTARELDCQHIWNAHAPLGRDNGVPDELIAALRERRPLPAMSPGDAAVVYLGQEFFQTHKVSRGAFQSALEQYGERGAVEIVLTMGSYALFSFAVNAFDTDLVADRTEPLLPV